MRFPILRQVQPALTRRRASLSSFYPDIRRRPMPAVYRHLEGLYRGLCVFVRSFGGEYHRGPPNLPPPLARGISYPRGLTPMGSFSVSDTPACLGTHWAGSDLRVLPLVTLTMSVSPIVCLAR